MGETFLNQPVRNDVRPYGTLENCLGQGLVKELITQLVVY